MLLRPALLFRSWSGLSSREKTSLDNFTCLGQYSQHDITLNKIVFRVPKITRTARTLYEIKGIMRNEIWHHSLAIERVPGLPCVADVWFGGFSYMVYLGRPEWSKVQTRGKPLVATAQATCVSAGEQWLMDWSLEATDWSNQTLARAGSLLAGPLQV